VAGLENHIVSEVQPVHIKDFARDYVLSLDEELNGGTSLNTILGKLINQAPTLFSKGNLEFLVNLNDNFKRDTISESYIYYRNCFVKVTKDGYTAHNFSELDGFIWDRQIRNRDFHISEGNSVFESFIFNICRKDERRFNSLRSAIGYLLHSYKDPANAKAIIFTDERIGEGANGGCGKSLVGEAISHLRNSSRPDGQNFRFDRFMFQSVNPGTAIIDFNDAKENFPFKKLFSIITDSMTIEKKYETAIILPFEYSPKILISTNHAIKGIDVSTLRRQFIVGFSDYYNEIHLPVHDFGKSFFDAWTVEEWNNFDNFMIGCLQFYLKNGLIDYDRGNLNKKMLIESTSEEFIEFMGNIELDKEYDNKELHKKFIGEYTDLEKLPQKTFTSWIKIYAKLNGYKYDPRKSGAKRSFSLTKIEDGRMDER